MPPQSGLPVPIIKEGPTFRDELKRQPQTVLQEGPAESLRLVPAKSAASGVYSVYFVPAHREWALVRLAKRYRWVFEIQLNRGMSGERQLIQQGFSPDDLDFLYDIIPAPAVDYNPIVYDMLWLVATYDEYRTLTEAILDRERFTPRTLFGDVSNVNEDEIGFLTRFLRSHLIQPVDGGSKPMHSRGTGDKSDLHANPDMRYKITSDGRTALEGILSEYDRIFEQAEFDPLLINSELNPRRHFVEYEDGTAEPTSDASIDHLQAEDGVLGEIASSFSSLVDNGEAETESDDAGETVRSNANRQPVRTRSEGASDRDGSKSGPSFEGESENVTTNEAQTEPEIDEQRSKGSPSTSQFGAYTRDEVVNGAVAAASCIHEHTVVRVRTVKEAVWKTVEIGDRDRSELWKYVTQVLLAMENVSGRSGGRIWAAV